MTAALLLTLALGCCQPNIEVDIFQEPQENRWEITLSEDEIDLLASIIMLEAGGECDWGQDAVVEVIFNRMYDSDYPNTLQEVLSEFGQFASWENRADADPTQEVYESIYFVLCGQTDILPFETVYFSRKPRNQKIELEIGDHVFCNK